MTRTAVNSRCHSNWKRRYIRLVLADLQENFAHVFAAGEITESSFDVLSFVNRPSQRFDDSSPDVSGNKSLKDLREMLKFEMTKLHKVMLKV